jgi:glycosyltransferase involved in cell wall biosynthesis
MLSRRLALLHFSNTSVRGGAEEHILTLLRGLDREYFALYLVCTPEVAQSLQPDLPHDVGVVALRGRPGDVAAAARFARILHERHIDILHSHLFHGSLFASPVGRLCRVPVIVETPHVREQWRRGLIKGHFFIDRLVGQCVDRYIAVSHANAAYLHDSKGLPAEKVHVIQNGCDLGRFDPTKTSANGLRARLGFEESDRIMVVVGRLEPQKGHRVLLDAMRAIVADIPQARLVCVGEGRLRAELERAVAHDGLETFVRFVGHQTNVPEWLALGEIVVLPSFFEGLPLAAIEALAAERPLVATAVDGTTEVVIDGQTGLTVPPGDPVALAQALGRLLGDGRLRRDLARAGRLWVIDRFSHDRQIRETQMLYLDAWRRSRRARQNGAGMPLVGGAG